MTSSADARSESPDRSFFRVPAKLPLSIEPIESARLDPLRADILGRTDPPLPDADPLLLAWLDRIERKLDELRGQSGLCERPLLTEQDRTFVEISGSGLSYHAETAPPLDQPLELHFELPETPVRLVHCVGRVVQVAPQDGSETSLVGVGFETIRPVDRDAVVHYTVAVQRQQIRAEHDDSSSSRKSGIE